ncbi:3-oxoacyl-[acyl-carrier-protein] synthase III C-terminal domain-containing protein [Vibrio splendidus]
MLCNIRDIEVNFASQTQPIQEAARELGLSALESRMFERFYGLKTLPYCADEPLVNLARPALENLITRHPDLLHNVKQVVHCHTIPSIIPFGEQPLLELTSELFGPAIEFASYTMGHCATALSALKFTAAQLKDDECAILLIAEKAFHKWVKLIPDTTIMGEAACAVVISKKGDQFKVMENMTSRAGQFALNSGYQTDKEKDKAFQESYTDILSAHIHKSFDACNIFWSELKYLIPHNVNWPSWKQVSNHIEIPMYCFFMDNIEHYGHCFGSDPFINLNTLWKNSKLKKEDTLMLFSVGLGSTASSAYIKCGDIHKKP